MPLNPPLYPLDFECVACGRPCGNGLRWCSMSCFYAEDGDDRDLDLDEPIDIDADPRNANWLKRPS